MRTHSLETDGSPSVETDVSPSTHPFVDLSKPVMFAIRFFPPLHGGSSVIMKNLLGALPPDKVVVATVEAPNPVDSNFDYPVYRQMRQISFSTRGNKILSQLQINKTARTVARLVKKHGCGAVVGVYPDISFLAVAFRAAQMAGVPFVPYLHDTVAEAMKGRMSAAFAARLQDQIFATCQDTFVMSEGMADMYRAKYNLETRPLVHSYPEDIPTEPPTEPPNGKGFWSGDIYAINKQAMVRVYSAMRDKKIELTIASRQQPQTLQNMGFDRGGIKNTFFSDRTELVSALREQSFLILALDQPDEAVIHADELSTIFPTKTIEYLASGRPILLHCPEHYFLARFCLRHDCAEVVADPSPGALTSAFDRLQNDPQRIDTLVRNGFKAARPFSRRAVAETFASGLETAWSR